MLVQLISEKLRLYVRSWSRSKGEVSNHHIHSGCAI
jgi:hypothetical protein